jgi:hypothetical protein
MTCVSVCVCVFRVYYRMNLSGHLIVRPRKVQTKPKYKNKFVGRLHGNIVISGKTMPSLLTV